MSGDKMNEKYLRVGNTIGMIIVMVKEKTRRNYEGSVVNNNYFSRYRTLFRHGAVGEVELEMIYQVSNNFFPWEVCQTAYHIASWKFCE